MNDRLANYFKNFNEELTDRLGSRFDYPKFLSYGKKNKASLFVQEDALNLPWIDELVDTIEKIKSIVEKVNPNIDPENFENSEYDTFEDRYIVFLIDQISSLLVLTSANIASSTKKISDYFINRHVPFGELKRLNNLGLLNNNNASQFENEKKLLSAREEVRKLMETNYYICHKNNIHFDDSSVCINSVIANDQIYGECYDFYAKLKDILSSNIDLPLPVRALDYHNYVLIQLLLALDKQGFVVLNGKSPEFDNKDYLAKIKKLELAKDNFVAVLTTENDDHIDLIFENKLAKNNKVNKVALELIPSLNNEVKTKEEANNYFIKRVSRRLEDDFDNAFVVTSIFGSQNQNVIVSSPYSNPFDANIENMIEACMVNFQGDAFTYQHFCPVCGGNVTNKDGNYRCSTCNSVYTLYNDNDKKEIVWMKRFSNLEGK